MTTADRKRLAVLRARLDRAWRGWLMWLVLGAGLAAAVAGMKWPPLVWVGWALLAAVVAVNLGYGVSLVRMLLNQRKRRTS